MINTLPDEKVLGFLHYLRHEGFTIGIQEAFDAIRVLHDVDVPDQVIAHHSMRSLTCRNHDEWSRFDKLFFNYWFLINEEDPPGDEQQITAYRFRHNTGASGFGGSSNASPYATREITGFLGAGAGRQRTISKSDFRFLNDRRAMREAEQMAEKLARKLERKLMRRHLIRSSGSEISIRHTIRQNLSHGGTPVELKYRIKKPEIPHIVILHDVSHSMAWNNPLLFRFARGLIRVFKTSEVFAFHTRLFHVTGYYRERSLDTMKKRLEAKNHLWLGGTCIANSLNFFNKTFANKYVTKKSIIFIISDGFDTDGGEYLASELACLKKNSGKIIWLNPMLGRHGYNPDKDSMLAAMPYLDRHVPAHSVDALNNTVEYVAKVCR